MSLNFPCPYLGTTATRCSNTARRDLCGGPPEREVPLPRPPEQPGPPRFTIVIMIALSYKKIYVVKFIAKTVYHIAIIINILVLRKFIS